MQSLPLTTPFPFDCQVDAGFPGCCCAPCRLHCGGRVDPARSAAREASQDLIQPPPPPPPLCEHAPSKSIVAVHRERAQLVGSSVGLSVRTLGYPFVEATFGPTGARLSATSLCGGACPLRPLPPPPRTMYRCRPVRRDPVRHPQHAGKARAVLRPLCHRRPGVPREVRSRGPG